MKILFFTDLHGDMNTLRKLKDKSKDVDVTVCAGDISVMETNIEEIMRRVNKFHSPVLMLHGNHEDEFFLRELCDAHDNITFLHKAVHHVEDNIIMGYGGDGFSTNDPEFVDVAESFFKNEIKGKKRMVLVTHGPPYDTRIDHVAGNPRGNKSYRTFIDEVKPHVVIAGHLHENEGKSHKIGRTIFINPGKKGVVVKL